MRTLLTVAHGLIDVSTQLGTVDCTIDRDIKDRLLKRYKHFKGYENDLDQQIVEEREIILASKASKGDLYSEFIVILSLII